MNKHSSFKEHVACLFEKDGWAFSIIYAVTFGGFIGLATFLPSYYYDQFGVSKVQAGQLSMLAAFMGAAVRVLGGWVSDHWGGVNTLSAVLAVVANGHRSSGQHDWRSRRAGRWADPQRHGFEQAAHRQLPVGLCRLCALRRAGAADAAQHANPLDAHLG